MNDGTELFYDPILNHWFRTNIIDFLRGAIETINTFELNCYSGITLENFYYRIGAELPKNRDVYNGFGWLINDEWINVNGGNGYLININCSDLMKTEDGLEYREVFYSIPPIFYVELMS